MCVYVQINGPIEFYMYNFKEGYVVVVVFTNTGAVYVVQRNLYKEKKSW